MATAAELLADVIEVDRTLVIDNSFRTIKIPSSVPNLGVEYDDDVLRLEFKMPRYVSDTDLSTFPIRINYINSNGESDSYTVRNPVIGIQYITFTWLVGPTATRYKGDTKFNVCLKKLDSDGYVDKEFNTTPATLPVLEGLEVDESVVAAYSDLIEQWRRELFGIGDTEEADIRAASQEEQEAIANKGAAVLATIPADYQTAVSMTDNADRTKADAVICSAEGESITVADSSDDYLRGLRIFGKTTQVSTTGKQLININQITKTNNGITFTPNPDGSVHVKGTATANAYFIFDSNNPVPVTETELIASISGSDQVYMVVGYFTSDGTIVNSIASVDDKTTSTFVYPTTAVTTRTFLGVNTGKTVDATVYPLVRLASNPDDSYEPYSGGFASPSPDWSQPLNSIESPTINIFGKNLLKNVASSSTSNGITFTVNEDGSVTVNGTATAGAWLNISGSFTLGKGTYILSGCPAGGAYSSTYVLSSTVAADYGNPKSFTLEEETSIVVNIGIYSGYTANNLTFHPMIRLATIEDDAYEPYKERQDLEISTVTSLPAVPVSEGGNYTDANGQQWICDEIDFERGVYVQRTKTITFDGTENWYISAAQYSSGTRFDVNISGVPLALSQDILCDRFVFKGPNAGVETAWVLADNAGFRIITEVASTVDELTQFLADNPTTVIYTLKVPIETALTAEEIQRFRFAHSNFPNTTVHNDAGATMELKYNADTKIWLENLPKATEDQIQKYINAWLDAHYTAAEGVSF